MIRAESESRRVRITKQMMKEALLELMAERPLAAVSVTQLCRKADVNRSTFYSYYNDLSELLREAEDDLIGQLPHAAQEETSAGPDLRMLEDFTVFFRYVRTHAVAFDLLLREGTSDFSERLLTAAMQNFPKQEEPEKSSRKKRWGYIYAMNGVIGLLRDWIQSGFPAGDREFAETVLRMSFGAYKAING